MRGPTRLPMSRLFPLAVGALATLLATPAFAQAPGPSEAPPEGPPGSVVVPSEGGGTVVVTPGSASSTTTYTPMGVPAPGTDINGHLPSSSRPINGDTNDSFDLNQGGGGNTVVYGPKGGEAILSTDRARERVPDIHIVKRG